MLTNNLLTKPKNIKGVRLPTILFLVLLFILPLVSCPLWGQVVQKKILTPADYHLWGRLEIDKVSSDEQWAAYKMEYESGNDTLFVRHKDNNKTYSLPMAGLSFFTKKSFACLTNTSLHILDLIRGTDQIIENVDSYTYSKMTDFLIIQTKNVLIIKSASGEIKRKIQNVNTFSIDPTGRQLVYSTFNNNEYGLFVIDLKKINVDKNILIGNTNKLTAFTWQKDGRSFSFFSQSDQKVNTSLYYYVLGNEKLFTLTADKLSKTDTTAIFIHNPVYKIVISDDLKKVFFCFKNVPNKIEKKPLAEIWNANDKWIYPYNEKEGHFENRLIALWLPEKNSAVALTTSELPKIMLSGDYKYAILSNPKAYEPQFARFGPRDYYILNLETFEKNIFLKKQPSEAKLIIPSPKGQYIAYFMENNWWIYDIKAKTHKNITKTIIANFISKEEALGAKSVCGNPGWSTDDNEILIYDQYDIWAVKPDGSSSRRLTHGRESKIRYRIAPLPNKNELKLTYDSYTIENFDLKEELFLKAQNEDKKTGFFVWKNKSIEKPIVFKDCFIDQLFYGDKKQNFFYKEQRFDQSLQLKIKTNAGENKTIFRSNPQQDKYYWGKSELIEYQTSTNRILKGALLYPANFDPSKKYPMIVSIYELESKNLHRYINPTLNDDIGFNPTVYTTQGYFVLLPDIILHENSDTGISAADCVIAATKKAISTGFINPDKIGLTGHSWGGYETAFIITRTNLFAVAVAGAGITDLKSQYFGIGKAIGLSDMWRYEGVQWKINKTPFEDALTYERNSPLSNAEKVHTPLLLWTGKEDETVNPDQTIKYYLALRRLNKKCIMLVYPNEDHYLINPANQIDLTTRMQEWFAYYLKDDLSAAWITEGTK